MSCAQNWSLESGLLAEGVEALWIQGGIPGDGAVTSPIHTGIVDGSGCPPRALRVCAVCDFVIIVC